MLQDPRWSHGCPAETPGETHSAEGGVSDLVQNVPHILGGCASMSTMSLCEVFESYD